MTFTPRTWADYATGGTPITAAELNRMEQGIDANDEAVQSLVELPDTISAHETTLGEHTTLLDAHGTLLGEHTDELVTQGAAIDSLGATVAALTGRRITGSGSPQGNVSADPGTAYFDTSGTAGAWLWIKLTGTGSTGWEVVLGDTKWRTITTLLTDRVSGHLRLRREGRRVSLRFDDLVTTDDPGTSFSQLVYSLDHPYRPECDAYVYFPLGRRSSSYTAGPLRISKFGQVLTYNNDGKTVAGDVSYLTAGPWPTSLLGTAHTPI